ncbi:MAG: 50S ribosomal protein L5 [Candidatus Aenigmarchaeota archaeon]|nr:50S ribosomal protein L5 [Candidatus Aenigmarchaeota archaeon]MBU5688950.1 50S ribosomal protein L5 [Candidatus Aenigmarchaeota archaeon]
MNPMRKVRLEKVTLNIGTTTDKEKLERALKLLEKLTGRKPVITKTHKRNTFGIAKGRPIGAKITLRGKEAEEMLKKILKGVDNIVKLKQINGGNFSIGVKEYIDLPGVNYDPDIGVLGFDCTVTLERPGFRVKRRKLRKAKIGKKHLITKEETVEWIKSLGVNVIE